MGLRELAAEAAAAHGCFTTATARRHGVSGDRLTRLRRDGIVEALHHGMFHFAGVPPTWVGRVAAALLAAGGGAVASHGTAACLLGLERAAARETLHVTTLKTSDPRPPGVVVHRTASLPDTDVVTIDGLRCTSGVRTVIDLAALLPSKELVALVDDAICARRASRGLLHRRAGELHNGRRGIGPILRVTRPGAEGEFWSWLERRFGELTREHGLPAAEHNVPLPGRPTIVVDALWREAPLVVELNGLRFHHTPTQRRKDDARCNAIALEGFPLLRFTWLDVVDEPERVVREVRAALHR